MNRGKKRKAILIISGIATLLLLSAGGILWMSSRPQKTDTESDRSNTDTVSVIRSIETNAETPATTQGNNAASYAEETSATENTFSDLPEIIETTVEAEANKASHHSASTEATSVSPKQDTRKNSEVAHESVPAKRDIPSPVDPTEKTTTRTTEVPTEMATTEITEKVTEKTTEAITEKTTTKPTEKPIEKNTEKTECSHTWVWATTTKTIHHDAVTDTYEQVVEPAWTEYFYVEKYHAGGKYYDTYEDFINSGWNGSYSIRKVVDHTVEHPAKYETVTEIIEPAYDESFEVNDYQYCSKCGAKK